MSDELRDQVRAAIVDRFGQYRNTVVMSELVPFVVDLVGQVETSAAGRLGGTLADAVDQAATAELARARRKYPTPHASGHEGWAVLLEEVEEAAEEVETLQDATADLWSAVRGDNPIGAHAAAQWVETIAVRAACELVQVIAVARRFRQDVPAPVGDEGRPAA